MTPAHPNADRWDERAQQWIVWARTPGHDAYWHYRDGFLASISASPGRLTLDLGCGEGRVARDLSTAGHTVVGVDRSERLVRAARDADASTAFVVADASALPFRSSSMVATVAYNTLMDIDDLPSALDEVARTLSPDGALHALIVHPVASSGTFDGDHDAAAFVLDDYFDRHREERTVERGGLRITLGTFHRTLQDYADALRRSGFYISRLSEPQPFPPVENEHGSDSARRGHRMPMFLQLTATKSTSEPHDGLQVLLTEWLEWFHATMPDGTPESFLLKADEEIAEFREQPSLEELSDVIVTLIGWLDLSGYNLDALIDSSRVKLQTNRTRRWQRLPDGRYKHAADI